MGPYETSIVEAYQERHKKFYPPVPEEDRPPSKPKDFTAEIVALRRELSAIRALLRSRGVLEKDTEEAELPKGRVIKCAFIKSEVASFYGLSVGEFDTRRKTIAISRPRQVAMYLCKYLTCQSLPEIGGRFGNRDHTTVLHALRKIEKLRLTDRELDSELTELERRIMDAPHDP